MTSVLALGLVPLVYAVVIAVSSTVLYLVLRFAIRDGLRAHHEWLRRDERR